MKSPIFYTHDQFAFELPPTHTFPLQKYRLVREGVLDSGLVPAEQVVPGPRATTEQLALAHTREYIDKVDHGGLSEKEVRRMGFPWSPELAERSRHSVGSTIAACRTALEVGMGVNLGGGTHHACADHGQGYCVYNDVAVAARVMQQEKRVDCVLVVDCDVHQGNGTASILQGDDSIFTFSIHGEKNFPFRKEASDLDIGLPDDTGDNEYLETLDGALTYLESRFTPDLVIYLAGADPYRGDRLGRLALSKAGLLARDKLVFEKYLGQGIPLAVVASGGYAKDVGEIVEIHLATLKAGLEVFQRVRVG